MPRKLFAFKVSFQGPKDEVPSERVILWPAKADMAILGRHAKATSHRLWKRAQKATPSGVTFSPHSYSHSLSVMISALMHAFLQKHPASADGGRLYRFFSDERAAERAISLVKKPLTQSVSFYAIDINSLPTQYDVALLLMRSRSAGGIDEVFAIPLVFGFENIVPDPSVKSGVQLQSALPSAACKVTGSLRLSIGESRLLLTPIFEEN
ncbi:MAG: hypothetical protein WCX64_01255 [Candidatus Micrarchaeia archaeon]|jgi:hypothetical protein